MWRTKTGIRTLNRNERALFVPAIAILSDSIAYDAYERKEQREYADGPFERLSPLQRLRVFVPVMQALLDPEHQAPLLTWQTTGPIRMLVEEVKCNLFTECELHPAYFTWRTPLLKCRVPNATAPDVNSTELDEWNSYVDRLGHALISDAAEDLGEHEIFKFPAEEPSDIEVHTLWERLESLIKVHDPSPST